MSVQKIDNVPKVKKPFYKRVWFIVLCVLVLLYIIGSTSEKPDTSTSAATSSQESSSVSSETSQSNAVSESSTVSSESSSADETVKWTKAGMYKVGADIPAGEYYVQADFSSYICVSKDSTGALESIITNDNFSSFTFVTVSDGQYFEVKGGKFALSSEIEPITTRGDGVYRVGIDLPAGEYKVKSNGALGSYFSIATDSSGSLNSIVSNDMFDGEKYVTVSDGQYFTLRGGEIVE